MRQLGQMKKSTKNSLFTYTLVIAAFVVVQALRMGPGVGAMLEGQLIPICATSSWRWPEPGGGRLRRAEPGPRRFHEHWSLCRLCPGPGSPEHRHPFPPAPGPGMVFGAVIAAALGFLIGIPVLRLNGDYLAIVTLPLARSSRASSPTSYLGVDENGLQFSFLSNKNELADGGVELIRGPWA